MRRGKGGARKRASKVAQMQRDQEKCGRPGSGELPSEATGPRCRRSSGDGRAAQWKGNLLATRLLGRGQGAASRERPSRASPGRGPGIHWHSVAQAVPGDEAATRSPGQGAPRGPDRWSGPQPGAPWAQHEAPGCAGFERSRLHLPLPLQQRSQKWELGRGHQTARSPGRPWRAEPLVQRQGKAGRCPVGLQGRRSWSRQPAVPSGPRSRFCPLRPLGLLGLSSSPPSVHRDSRRLL